MSKIIGGYNTHTLKKNVFIREMSRAILRRAFFKMRDNAKFLRLSTGKPRKYFASICNRYIHESYTR